MEIHLAHISLDASLMKIYVAGNIFLYHKWNSDDDNADVVFTTANPPQNVEFSCSVSFCYITSSISFKAANLHFTPSDHTISWILSCISMFLFVYFCPSSYSCISYDGYNVLDWALSYCYILISWVYSNHLLTFHVLCFTPSSYPSVSHNLAMLELKEWVFSPLVCFLNPNLFL